MFQEIENTQAFLKVGLLGFTGSGKSTTATNLAGGLVLHMREKGLELANKPIYFLDTENGADFIKPLLQENGIALKVWKTRSFKDLVEALDLAEKDASVLIIDSITHFWVELTATYKKQKNRTSLAFSDWDFLKSEWRKFTDKFVNNNLHIVMCGRAGYEYDYFETDEVLKNGKNKMELEKTGIKMKAESETGYEASLLVLMERHQELENNTIKTQYRTATILKDRTRKIDGKVFTNPKFSHFLPHIEFLNLGSKQGGIDLTRNSESIIEKPERNSYWDNEQKKVALDEIDVILNKHFPGSSAAEKKAKADLLEKFAQTRSWEKLQTLGYEKIKAVREALWMELEKMTYHQSFKEGTSQSSVEVQTFLWEKMEQCASLESLQKFKEDNVKLFENMKIISSEDHDKFMAMVSKREEEFRAAQ